MKANNETYNTMINALDAKLSEKISKVVRVARESAKEVDSAHSAILALTVWGMVSSLSRSEWKAVYKCLCEGFRSSYGAIDSATGTWASGYWSTLSQYAASGSTLVIASCDHYGQTIQCPESMIELRRMYKALLAKRSKSKAKGKKQIKITLEKRFGKASDVKALAESILAYSETHDRKSTLALCEYLRKHFNTFAGVQITKADQPTAMQHTI